METTADDLKELLRPPSPLRPESAASRRRVAAARRTLALAATRADPVYESDRRSDASAIAESHTYSDVLCAYAQCCDDDPGLAQRVHPLLTVLADEVVNAREVVLALARLATTYRDERVTQIAADVVGPLSDLSLALIETDTLGMVSASVFDVIFVRANVRRAGYLVYRLRTVRPALTRDQADLARTLASGWDATLDALVDTARTLRPKPAR